MYNMWNCPLNPHLTRRCPYIFSFLETSRTYFTITAPSQLIFFNSLNSGDEPADTWQLPASTRHQFFEVCMCETKRGKVYPCPCPPRDGKLCSSWNIMSETYLSYSTTRKNIVYKQETLETFCFIFIFYTQ